MNDTVLFRKTLLVSLTVSLVLGVLSVAARTASPGAPTVRAPHHSGPRCMECPPRGR
jgi:hypothetical protein